MKRLLLASISMITFGSIAIGGTLSPEEALGRLNYNSGPLKMNSRQDLQLKMTRYNDNKPVMYIFSRGTDEGFVVVSANDNSAPLLGYSDHGTFTGNENELPDGLKYWLESLGSQIAYNKGIYTAPRRASNRESISPLTTTKWNQNAPYNDDCPEQNGSRCVTGCVATAFAQLLKYYNYPTQGTGTHEYDWKTGGKELSFDYGSTTFDWANMMDRYDDQSTETEKEAVAQLMYACGVSVNMDYTSSESGASSYDIIRAIIENFNYDQGVEYHERDYYSLSEWEQMVYDNLSNYGPVLYGGQSNSGGHEFICDGYENGYFHFNWGWGGMSDGYFLLTALDPESQGIGGSTGGYNFGQDIITHVSPDKTSTSFYKTVLWSGDFTINQSTASLGSYISYTGSMFNYSYGTLEKFKLGLLITSQNGTSTFITSMTNGISLPNEMGYNNQTFNVMLPSNLQNGTYTVQPAFTCDGVDQPEVVPVAINNRGYYTMTVQGRTATFSAQQTATLSVSNLSLESPIFIGSDFKLSGTLLNNSASEEFYGEVLAVITDGQSSVVATGEPMQMDIEPGASVDWEYLSSLTNYSQSDITSGETYYLYLCTIDSSGSKYVIIGGPIQTTINETSTTTLKVTNLKVNAMEGTKLSASATVECTKGYFAGTLTLAIFPETGGTDIAAYSSDFFAVGGPDLQQQGIDVPSSTTIIFNVDFSLGKPETKYMAAIFNGQTQLSNGVIFETGENTGIDSINDSAEVTSREYYTLSGLPLGNKPSASGIYIVKERHDDGTVKTFKISL